MHRKTEHTVTVKEQHDTRRVSPEFVVHGLTRTVHLPRVAVDDKPCEAQIEPAGGADTR